MWDLCCWSVAFWAQSSMSCRSLFTINSLSGKANQDEIIILKGKSMFNLQGTFFKPLIVDNPSFPFLRDFTKKAEFLTDERDLSHLFFWCPNFSIISNPIF